MPGPKRDGPCVGPLVARRSAASALVGDDGVRDGVRDGGVLTVGGGGGVVIGGNP